MKCEESERQRVAFLPHFLTTDAKAVTSSHITITTMLTILLAVKPDLRLHRKMLVLSFVCQI
jgi:hypothetical protein